MGNTGLFRLIQEPMIVVAIVITALLLVLPIHEKMALEFNVVDAEHDQHNPNVQATDAGRLYSLFMHHTCGYLLLLIGILMGIARARASHSRQLRYAIGTTWLLFALVIFVGADPDGWPIRMGLQESWTMPSRAEWLQHKILSCIPFLLSLSTFRPELAKQSKLLLLLAVAGAIGLMSHQHLNHPVLDLVNLQHRFFAATCLLMAVSSYQEARGAWEGNGKKLIIPALVILLALQLTWYTE
jgi:hypothetical protein